MNKNILTTLIVAIVFGLVVLTIVLAGFTVPIPGTGVVTDPREIFVTIGSALTGPLGALVIGFFAGIVEPGGIPLASLLGHIAGGLWMAFAKGVMVEVLITTTVTTLVLLALPQKYQRPLW